MVKENRAIGGVFLLPKKVNGDFFVFKVHFLSNFMLIRSVKELFIVFQYYTFQMGNVGNI